MDRESWLTGELASFACGACGQAYGEERVRLIAQREELFFVDLACAHCGSQAVAIVSVQLEDPPLTEPEAGGARAGTGDPVASHAQEAVSSDDVLDVHRLLADHVGDLRSLLDRLDGRAA